MTKNKMFKDVPKLDGFESYSDFVAESLKPIGFSDSVDKTFFSMKVEMFRLLFQEIENSGESFDVEICFSSMIDDLVDTFNEVGPSLLQMQRDSFANEE